MYSEGKKKNIKNIVVYTNDLKHVIISEGLLLLNPAVCF